MATNSNKLQRRKNFFKGSPYRFAVSCVNHLTEKTPQKQKIFLSLFKEHHSLKDVGKALLNKNSNKRRKIMANQQDWNKRDDMDQENASEKNQGSFKNDPERASREGKKGGEASKGRRS